MVRTPVKLIIQKVQKCGFGVLSGLQMICSMQTYILAWFWLRMTHPNFMLTPREGYQSQLGHLSAKRIQGFQMTPSFQPCLENAEHLPDRVEDKIHNRGKNGARILDTINEHLRPDTMGSTLHMGSLIP